MLYTASDVALWFMYQPMLINKSVYEGLNKAQQTALMEGAAIAQKFYLDGAKKADKASADVFEKQGVKIANMSNDDFNKWRAIAQKTSYKNFVESYPDGQRLLDLALSVE